MQIALIADLHGNRPAVEALEKDLALLRPDQIICLGDIVGKGPSNDFTFDWAMAHCDLILGGNWDYGVGQQAFPNDLYYWQQLGEERMKTLRELPREHEITLSGRRIRLFHGRPVMENLITAHHPLAEIEPFFSDAQGNCGHLCRCAPSGLPHHFARAVCKHRLRRQRHGRSQMLLRACVRAGGPGPRAV